ncbi:MAG: glycosyltransferase family 2 protein [Sedimenticola sp.]|uniref:Glycosyltransferase family 2 protein n=1 Tax=Sedimenticola thiotaurini TaxID=1543721 RepID=A0A558DAS6_9GAMM|nr:glycosyltransferase family 2 protein [Sedimenticola sp.]MDF1529026.1 glycosyltransferase family 2 protein [Sedimenticola sp.]TVT58122.1 MAG: glycosyltransferase family 2 protein [Sedimenticola thiotaurini]
MKISLVAPFYNEEEGIEEFFTTVIPILEQAGDSFEIICVNDGSSDKTLELLSLWSGKRPEIVVVNLARNFGKEIALTAGLDHSNGDVVIPIDSDLQDPPELIPEMIAKWREGYDVVYATRTLRDMDSWFKRWSAELYYRLFNLVTDTKIPFNAGDYRLMDRRVVTTIGKMRERSRFMKGVFAWVGYRQTSVEYARPERFAGQESQSFKRLWKLAVDGIISFSTIPLRIWSYVGLFIALLSFLYGLMIITKTLFFGVDIPGYASTMVIILFLGGVQLMSLGVLGEYIGRIFEEVKKRPLYVVDKPAEDDPRNDES